MKPEIPFDALREAAQSQIDNTIFVTISGAHLYGFPSPDSDFDLRGNKISKEPHRKRWGILAIFVKASVVATPKASVNQRKD